MLWKPHGILDEVIVNEIVAFIGAGGRRQGIKKFGRFDLLRHRIVRPCSRPCIATPHAQVTGRTRNNFATDLKAESQPTAPRTDERLEKRNRFTVARQARAIRDMIATD